MHKDARKLAPVMRDFAAYIIHRLFGAKRLTTSGLSRRRVSASELASPLTADLRRFGEKKLYV